MSTGGVPHFYTRINQQKHTQKLDRVVLHLAVTPTRTSSPSRSATSHVVVYPTNNNQDTLINKPILNHLLRNVPISL